MDHAYLTAQFLISESEILHKILNLEVIIISSVT